MTTCKNCGTTFEGKFCSNCSQKADTHRFTVKHFAHEFFHAFTHTDKGIFFLMKELFIRPGKVAREFNEGKRKKYFNPITYLLIVMALQIFLSQKTGFYDYYFAEMQKLNKVELSRAANPAEAKLKEVMAVTLQQIDEHNKVINLLLLPVLAGITWLMFRRSGSNYAEILVLDVLTMAQILLLFVLLCIVPFLLYKGSALFTLNVYFILSIVYLIVAMKQFFQHGWLKTIWKGLVVQILYYITMFIMVFAVMVFLFFR